MYARASRNGQQGTGGAEYNFANLVEGQRLCSKRRRVPDSAIVLASHPLDLVLIKRSVRPRSGFAEQRKTLNQPWIDAIY